jgi:erythromycin esterase
MQGRAGQVSRDRSMAENVKWILDQAPGAKIVLWAHNGHVAAAGRGAYQTMGKHLREMYGGEMVVFGFAFNQGSFQAVEPGKALRDFTVPPAPEGSLDAMLAAAGIPLLAIDLRLVPPSGRVGDWLRAARRTRSIGALFQEGPPDAYMMNLNAPQSFDALLFVDKTTAARKNPPLAGTP